MSCAACSYRQTFTVHHTMNREDGSKIVFEDYMQFCVCEREFDVIKTQEPYKLVDGKAKELTKQDREEFDEWFDKYTRSREIDDVIQSAFEKSYL